MSKQRRFEALAGAGLVALAVLFTVACGDDESGGSPTTGSDDDGDNSSSGSGGSNNGSNTGSGAGTGNGIGSGSGGLVGTGGGSSEPDPVPELPDEADETISYRSPVVTGRFLWSPNPVSGRVALIDTESLGVRVLAAGLYPTFAVGVPGSEDAPSALVINAGSSDVSVYRVSGKTVSEARVKIHTGANAWAVSPDGKWAIAWTAARVEDSEPTDSRSEVSLIGLSEDEPSVQRITVGYRPEQVVFDESSSRALVVSESDIGVIPMGVDVTRAQSVDLTDSDGQDVSITADGYYAVVRREGQNVVEVIPIDAPADRITLTLSGEVTDLDLARTGRAVALVREKRQMFTFDVSQVLADPSLVDSRVLGGELIGSAAITQEGEYAVLFTTAVESDRVSVVNLTPGAGYLGYRTQRTYAPVAGVTTSPDGKHAVIENRSAPGTSSGAFAVLSLAEARFPRVVGTSAPIEQVVIGNDAAVVSAAFGSVHEVHVVTLPTLALYSRGLASPPLAVGLVGEVEQGFAAQVHPEGRVTLFPLDDEGARTLTGFELSAEVVR